MNGKPVENATVFIWWKIKRKINENIFEDIVKIHKTATDEKGKFFVEKFP